MVTFALLSLWLAGAPPAPSPWRALVDGVELGEFTLEAAPTHGDGKLHVVRVDPRKAKLDLGLASEGGQPHTAAEWSHKKGFVVTINAGMYEKDFRTNVGHLSHHAHVNQARWKAQYQSVLLLHPRVKGAAPARLVDRDSPDAEALIAQYETQVQNLRLVKGPGVGVWSPNGRSWSEAFVADDDQGRLLFAFSRTPFEMAELMRRVLALPLGVQHAMHVEGGPEASFSVHTASTTVDLAGSFETGFFEHDGNEHQWAIPNVLGVVAP
jgi:hypothetical protein